MPTVLPETLLDTQRIVPSEMRTRDWAAVDQWTRERSFWMASVTHAEILQEMRDMAAANLRGDRGEWELYQQWLAKLDAVGYQPDEGTAGTIKDLRSLRRFTVALRTNVRLLQSWALMENGRRPGPLLTAPCWELIRVMPAQQPRDWAARWTLIGGQITAGRIIAPKLSPLWAQLGDPADFDDALGVDYPPFCWGSGMGWRAVPASEAMTLGIMTRDQIRAQAQDVAADAPLTSPGETLHTRPHVRDTDLRDHLTDQLGGLAQWDHDTLHYTDPNGTRPATQDQLLHLWSRPLPEPFHTAAAPDGHLQRAALLAQVTDNKDWTGKNGTDVWEDYQRLLARLINTQPPPPLQRGMSMTADKLNKFLTQLKDTNEYAIRKNQDDDWLHPGDRWTSNDKAAATYARLDQPPRSDRWSVLLTLATPDTEAFKDISRLVSALSHRIPKQAIPPVTHEAEWVMRAGTILRVAKITRDPKTRLVTITLTQ